jgi:hypothetical protein
MIIIIMKKMRIMIKMIIMISVVMWG